MNTPYALDFFGRMSKTFIEKDKGGFQNKNNEVA